MSNADDLQDGATTILRNSTFMYNRVGEGNGGVVSLGDYAFLLMEGDRNVFAYNEVSASGAVFAGVEGSRATVEGGDFYGNTGEKARTSDVARSG